MELLIGICLGVILDRVVPWIVSPVWDFAKAKLAALKPTKDDAASK